MPYQFQPKKLYMMPTSFGPRPYRRGSTEAQDVTYAYVSFLTNKEQLEELLPPGFELRGEPIMTVLAIIIGHIEWLAGHGYNILGVSIPVTYQGEKDRAVGTFIPTLWENQADAIIQGREIWGCNKLYADITMPAIYQNEWHISGSWMNFTFLDIYIKDMTAMSPKEIEVWQKSRQPDAPEGVLSGDFYHKYIPKTGTQEADVSYVVLNTGGRPPVIRQAWRGEGRVEFHKATWKQLPTMQHVINKLAELEIKEYHGGIVTDTTGESAEVPGQNPFHILR